MSSKPPEKGKPPAAQPETWTFQAPPHDVSTNTRPPPAPQQRMNGSSSIDTSHASLLLREHRPHYYHYSSNNKEAPSSSSSSTPNIFLPLLYDNSTHCLHQKGVTTSPPLSPSSLVSPLNRCLSIPGTPRSSTRPLAPPLNPDPPSRGFPLYALIRGRKRINRLASDLGFRIASYSLPIGHSDKESFRASTPYFILLLVGSLVHTSKSP